MSVPTMLGSLTRRLTRRGWQERDTRGTDLQMLLEWGGSPVTARLTLTSGGALILQELGPADRPTIVAAFHAVTADTVDRVDVFVRGAEQ